MKESNKRHAADYEYNSVIVISLKLEHETTIVSTVNC